MTETPSAAPHGWHVSEETAREEQVSDLRARAQADYHRAGHLYFAKVILTLIGALQIVVGLTAIFRSGTYVVPESRLVVDVDYTGWGWLHICLGVVAVAAAYGLQRGEMWARVAGIVIASLSALAHLAFLAANPVASTIVIALDVAVIYVISVYGPRTGAESGY